MIDHCMCMCTCDFDCACIDSITAAAARVAELEDIGDGTVSLLVALVLELRVFAAYSNLWLLTKLLNIMPSNNSR